MVKIMNNCVRLDGADINKDYWYTGRKVQTSSGLRFLGERVDKDGKLNELLLARYWNSSSSPERKGYTNGVRIVVRLKDNLSISDSGEKLKGKIVWNLSP